MRALILAAGKGQRLRPLTLFTPKPLLEVGRQTLIERHIEQLKSAGITDIVINTSWLAQKIIGHLGHGKRFGVRLRYSHEGDEPLETGGGIFNALPLLGEEPFIVVNGDTWHDINFSALRLEQGDLVNLVLVNNPEHNPKGDFVLDGQRLKKRPDNVCGLTYSGVGIYHPALFHGCQAGKWSVVPLIHQAIENGQAAGCHHRGHWHDIGTLQRLLQACEIHRYEQHT